MNRHSSGSHSDVLATNTLPFSPSLAEQLFQTSRRPAVVLDLELRVKIANRAFYEVFDFTPESTEKRSIAELSLAGSRAQAFQDHLDQVRWGTAQLEDFPVQLDLADIGRRDFLLSAGRVDSEGEGAQAILILLEDVTERKLAKELAESHKLALERSNSELELFAYVASHDLQEPLRMVASFTQLLGERYRGRLDADADEFIHYAVDGVHRMQALIDGLLAYSRIDARGAKFQGTNFDELLAIVQFDLQQVIAESGAVVTSDPLPVVTVDARQIRQLFQNLLSNAIKFRRPGIPPGVHVSASRRNGDWLFSVKDNGIGIAPDQSGRLFQIFQRLHNRSEYPGTGIGLAVCKKIVERHGGRIWIESAAQEGCTFFFTIPQKAEENTRP